MNRLIWWVWGVDWFRLLGCTALYTKQRMHLVCACTQSYAADTLSFTPTLHSPAPQHSFAPNHVLQAPRSAPPSGCRCKCAHSGSHHATGFVLGEKGGRDGKWCK